MPGWLTRASDALSRRQAPSAPAPFEITCPCGTPIYGVRRQREQRILCRKCGEAFFVLPINVYPQPAAPKPSKRKRGKPVQPPAPNRAEPANVEPPDDESADAQPSVERPRAFKTRKPRPAKVQGIDLSQLSDRAANRRSPLRLIVVAISVVIAITTYWIVHTNSREHDQLLYRDSLERGQQALAQSEFATAAQALDEARHAMKRLGGDVQDADIVEQLWREATAADNLTPAALLEIVNEAQNYRNDQTEDWREHFEVSYAGGWVVIDADVSMRPAVDDQQTDRYEIDYPLAVGEIPVELRADLSAFKPLSLNQEPQRVVFAAQLQECRLAKAPTRWILTLRDQPAGKNVPAAFLWSNLDNYRRLGFVDDDVQAANAIAGVLQRQSQILKAAP